MFLCHIDLIVSVRYQLAGTKSGTVEICTNHKFLSKSLNFWINFLRRLSAKNLVRVLTDNRCNLVS